MMNSKLFQQLAKLPGVNLFNWKDKTVRIDPIGVREQPLESMTPAKLYFLAYKYFSKVIVQDKYINCLQKMVTHYELEVEKLDLMQARHEQELDQIKAECESKIKEKAKEVDNVLDKTDSGRLHKRIKNLELKNAELQVVAKRNLLTDEKMTELMAYIENVARKIDVPNANRHAGRVKEISDRLTSLIKTFTEAKKVQETL
jgi:hypothetical protein